MFDYDKMFDAILPLLQDKKKNFNSKDKENYSFKCTHHQDKTASAYIALKSDGGLVAGCRTCGSSYGLNTMLADLGLNKMDFVEKSETYYSKENLIQYIKENNVGNVFKDDNGAWIVDTDYRFDNAYFYTDERGTLVSVKVKYKLINPSSDKKNKRFAQRVIRENKIISSSVESVDQLPKQYIYNAAAVQNAIRKGYYIYLVEGEKDADTLIYHGLAATSFATGAGSMFDDYKSQLRGAKLVLLGDFDGPGRNHVEKCREFLFDDVEKMYIVEYLPELSKVPGDKLDVTDWLNAGHNVKELTDYVFDSCLDVKNIYKLQEHKDYGYGIWKCTDGKEDAKNKKQITNFTIDGINIINRVDTEEEYFEMIIKTQDNRTLKRRGSILVFNDVRKFRDFLNSSDLVFRGTIDVLIDLKEWCFKYKKRDTTTAYDVGGIRKINDKWLFVTSDGSFDNDFVYDQSKIFYEDDNFSEFQNVILPTKEEVESIYESLLNFNKKEITYTALGHVGAMLLNGKYKTLDIKLNHLAIFGEAGAGKSTIAEKIIMPLMNYNVKSNARDVTNFGFLKETSTNTTTPFFADEYKPSTFMLKKNQELSNLFRNIYDRNSSVRGNKNLTTTKITPVRPLVIIGEEGYWQDETALIERSNIIYASKATRSKESLEHIDNLTKNKDVLNKFGKLLVKIALEVDENKFLDFRKKCEKLVDFKDRVYCTFTNTIQGLNIIRIAFKFYGIELDFKEGVEYIKKNIYDNVLQNSNEAKTQIEKMFEITDEMISNKISLKDGLRVDKENDAVYMYIPVIYPAMKKYIREYNLDENVLGKNDFIKQLKGSKYLTEKSVVNVRVNGSVKKCYKLSLDLLDELGLDNICMFTPVSEEVGEQEKIPF